MTSADLRPYSTIRTPILWPDIRNKSSGSKVIRRSRIILWMCWYRQLQCITQSSIIVSDQIHGMPHHHGRVTVTFIAVTRSLMTTPPWLYTVYNVLRDRTSVLKHNDGKGAWSLKWRSPLKTFDFWAKMPIFDWIVLSFNFSYKWCNPPDVPRSPSSRSISKSRILHSVESYSIALQPSFVGIHSLFHRWACIFINLKAHRIKILLNLSS